ncbi:MAG: RNA-binding protein [Spirochaetales bacterium]|nr:MAG: RNA-binding protein [Spirochaetales bacterium]
MAKKLYVGNMSYDTTEEKLRQLFTAHGEVVSVNVIMDHDTRRPKGFGFVEMGSDKEAQAAISALNGSDVDGRQSKVNEANDRPPRRESNRW